MIQRVIEVVSSVLLPLAQKRSWRNRNLVRCCTDYRFHINPVRVSLQIIVPAIVGAIAFQWAHELLLAQSVLMPIIRVGEFPPAVIPDHGSNGVVEKCSILVDLDVADGIFKSAIFAL